MKLRPAIWLGLWRFEPRVLYVSWYLTKIANKISCKFCVAFQTAQQPSFFFLVSDFTTRAYLFNLGWSNVSEMLPLMVEEEENLIWSCLKIRPTAWVYLADQNLPHKLEKISYHPMVRVSDCAFTKQRKPTHISKNEGCIDTTQRLQNCIHIVGKIKEAVLSLQETRFQTIMVVRITQTVIAISKLVKFKNHT